MRRTLMFNTLGREQRFTTGSEALEVVREYMHLEEVVSTDLKNEAELG